MYDKCLDPCGDNNPFRRLYFYNKTIDYISWNNTKCITPEKLCHFNYTSLIEEDVCFYQYRKSTPPYLSMEHMFIHLIITNIYVVLIMDQVLLYILFTKQLNLFGVVQYLI